MTSPDVDATIEQLEFNATHLVAEADLDDALIMLDVAREVMRNSAASLRAYLAATARDVSETGETAPELEYDRDIMADALRQIADATGTYVSIAIFAVNTAKQALSCAAPLASLKAVPEVEPVAHIVERLDGSNRCVVLVERYDPRKPDFWVDEERRAQHRVTPLYATPQPSPDAEVKP